MVMDQSLINAIFTALGAALAFILRVIWEGLRELQTADNKLSAEISTVRLMMADSYIKKEDFDRLSFALFAKLDKIEAKLDHKVDR